LQNLAPAGILSSCAGEAAYWLLMQLYRGRFVVKQVVPKEAILKTWTPQTIVNTNKSTLSPNQFGLYGLGWFINDYAGRRVVSHDGGVDGFVSTTCFLPEERLGILVFTNTDANNFYTALRLQILDAFLNQPYKNYHQIFLNGFRQQDKAERERIRRERERAALGLPTSLPLKDYVGKYRNSVYGDAEVKLEKEGLVVYFEHHPTLRAPLKSKGESEFLATYSNPTMGIHPVPFKMTNGKVVSMRIKVNDFVEYGGYTFTKR
ncbi:MAG: serine hydrolase, partial [Cytophagaceae bacterium]|nr:serine hydrolase [Cytophagaceae bacterium]